MKFYGTRGLRSWRSKCKGASLRHKINCLRYALQTAWQRAWYGYSFDDICEFHGNMAEQIAAMLRSFKDCANFFVLVDPDTHKELTWEEAERIYDRMIKCVEYGNDEDLCYEELCGVNPYEDTFNFEQYKAAYELHRKYKREAFELLGKYWYQLWL